MGDHSMLIETQQTGTHSDVLSRLAELTDLEAVELCVEVVLSGTLEGSDIARAIIEAGLARGEVEAKRVETKIASTSTKNIEGDESAWASRSDQEIQTAINQAVGDDERVRRTVHGYGTLYQARCRLDTYFALYPSPATARKPDSEQQDVADEPRPLAGDGQDVELEDPWAEGNAEDEVIGAPSTVIDDPWETGSATSDDRRPDAIASPLPADDGSEQEESEPEPLITVGEFVAQPLLVSAIALSSAGSLASLKALVQRHISELGPYRYSLLEALPAWVLPSEVKEQGLLPRVGDDDREILWVDSHPAASQELFGRWPSQHSHPEIWGLPALPPKSLDELLQWFISRVNSLDELGVLDLQLAWVQHGASTGIPGLDALGEDLSLLSRLIYDADLDLDEHEKWTLAGWRAASERDIVAAYLSSSTPSTIVADVRRLVLPYLYVLESRAERQGQPDPHLVERLLHEAVLSLPLHTVLPVFEASKATLPMSERLIRNDQNVARLALACLYGSDEREVWSVMSSIFECLPVWDVSGGDLESDKEATSTTLDSIATFVRPTTSSAKPPTAKDLFIFFSPLPFASLSRALDILDVHLESGEILARWGTAVQLRFLLQSARDKDEQLQLAEKMVRRQAVTLSPDRWPKLWEDMCRLSGGDDALLRGAFGTLSIEDMMKVYLSGLLSSGKFDVARKMIRRFEQEYDLEASALQSVALATSRELYDNADTGNIHTGEMRIAYECLAIPPSSPELQRERAFIEATSRLASFAKISLSPFQIQHAKNKLDLIRRILSTSDDAYRHDSIILDLADKLGVGDTLSRAQVLGMLADVAVTHGEYDLAYSHAQKLVDMAKARHKRRTADEDEKMNDVAFKTCLELGRQDEWSEIDKRMLLLGRAVEFCPPDIVPSVLVTWRSVEDGSLKLSQAAKRRRLTGVKQPFKPAGTASVTASPIVGSEEERVLGSRTAARAARMALGFGERFKDQIPFRSGISPRLPSMSSSREASRDRTGGERRSMDSDRVSLSGLGFGERDQTDAERVSRHARRALVKGVGWLLGADERELQ